MNTEQTKKCRQCQMDIPKKARRCSHCRAKQGMGLGGLLVVIMFVGIMTSVVMSSLNDARTPAPTPVAQIPQSNFELGMYTVESEEFQYMEQSEVNLWQSFSDRTKLGSVAEGDVVEVTKHDPVNDYCLVSIEEQKGWMACGWLVKSE